MDRLSAELEHLRTTVRPQVILRVKTAREFGDLKENGDYEYARKEQSFVEGRIQALEALMRTGVVMDSPQATEGAALGSTVVVESDGDKQTYLLVSSAEANAAAGRISNVSPVGRALIGARAGDEVTVQLPGGSIVYQVLEVS
jgi:transcription elongation factor GreA